MEFYTNAAAKSGKLFLPKSADAYFKIDGELAFIAKANTAANVQIQTTQNQIKGGKNNAVIGVVTSEKAINVSFTTPEWQPEFLAANVGTKIKVGSQNFYIDDEVFTAGENGVVTLTETTADGAVQIETAGGWVKVPVKEDNTVDLAEYGFENGDCVTLLGIFPREGIEISLSVDTDPSVGELVLSSDIYKGTLGKVGTAEYVFPAFALSGNWTQAFSNDASYEISGTPIAVAGEKCGEGETYGYYRQYLKNDESLTQFVSITASPSVVELDVNEKQQLSVYGIRGALSDKADITANATFTVADGGATIASVDAKGVVTGLAAGNATIDVAYGEGKYSTKVTVSVTAAPAP